MKYLNYLIIAAVLAVSCKSADVRSITVVPYPNEVSVKNGTFDASGADVHYDAMFDGYAKDAIHAFAAQLSLTSGSSSKVHSTLNTEWTTAIPNWSIPLPSRGISSSALPIWTTTSQKHVIRFKFSVFFGIFTAVYKRI